MLDVTSQGLIISQASQIETILKAKSKKKTWTFCIEKDNPVTFRGIKIGKSQFEIDYMCEIEGDGSKIIYNNFQTRIWTDDKELCYRKSFDSEKVKSIFEKNGWRRVLMRFRVDTRKEDVKHLELFHHMHIGGAQDSCEYCWIHENISEPRLLHPPMDFILFSEFVTLNYYFSYYDRLYKDSEWIRIVRNSQKIFQHSYYEKCQNMLNLDRDSDTIVSHFCK